MEKKQTKPKTEANGKKMEKKNKRRNSCEKITMWHFCLLPNTAVRFLCKQALKRNRLDANVKGHENKNRKIVKSKVNENNNKILINASDSFVGVKFTALFFVQRQSNRPNVNEIKRISATRTSQTNVGCYNVYCIPPTPVLTPCIMGLALCLMLSSFADCFSFSKRMWGKNNVFA